MATTLDELIKQPVVIVAGKGGVGKTTVTAVFANAAARRGARVLAVELDSKPQLAKMLPDVDTMTIDPGDALEEYLVDHGFGRAAKRLIRTGVIDLVATATPGINDVVVLGKIKQLQRSGDYDVIVVDGPAAGHAISMLTAARGLLDVARSGPVHRQAAEVNEMLTDPSRCGVVLTTLAETTPVNELIETAYNIEERCELTLNGVVVNQLLTPMPATIDAAAASPGAAQADAFVAARRAAAESALTVLDVELPLPQIRLPLLPVAGLAARDIDGLATLVVDAPSAGAEVANLEAAGRRLVGAASAGAASDGATSGGAASDGDDAARTLVAEDLRDLGPVGPPPADAETDQSRSDGPSSGGLPTAAGFGNVVESHDVLLCVGSGGVGKTTTAAAIALGAAQRGRKVVVVTIDPARRLADALGMPGGLTNSPTQLTLNSERDAPDRAAGGELWAMMLNPTEMLTRVVQRYAADEDQVRRIVENRLFHQLATNLSGTQEYMASEALYELHEDPRFDLVIVDTPPSRQTLTFLESPGVLSRFFSHRLFRLMMLPTRTSLKLIGDASQALLRQVGKVVGSDVLADTSAFFQAFAGMDEGFRLRAEAVDDVLQADTTGFVLTSSANTDTVDEALWFARRLSKLGYQVDATIINRIMARFGDGELPTTDAVHAEPGTSNPSATNLTMLRTIARAEREVVGPLTRHSDVVVEVPLLDQDVHDAALLETIADELFATRS